jgi:hypothetical protein
VALKFPYLHGFVTKLYEQQAKVIATHTLMLAVTDKANRITKYMLLKAGGSGAYGRSKKGAVM